MERWDVIVVGGGAAGILASWRAASVGARTLLLEKTQRLGTKILISGGGKCNITHDGPIEVVLSAFRSQEARFLKPSFYRFPPSRIVEMLSAEGLEMYTRSDGRIFPSRASAKEVLRMLLTILQRTDVEIRTETPVIGLQRSGSWEVSTGDQKFQARAVVLTPGGASYPNSGTTGDGWSWLTSLGHKVEPIRAALAPIYLHEAIRPASGVTLSDVTLRGKAGKEIDAWRGDLLFTHQGVSGPCALGISRKLAELQRSAEIVAVIDLLPDQNPEDLERQLLERARQSPHLLVRSAVSELVPEAVAVCLLQSAEVPADSAMKDLNRNLRKRLCELLRHWPIGAVRAIPMELGEVVAGGVSLAQVNPGTMQSRVQDGLFLAGEILDIAGPVGGYNLQAAWATGYVAGESAANHALGFDERNA